MKAPVSVSVVVRSFNRLDPLFELLAVALDQDYPDYEVVVIEQSTKITPEHRARLEALEAQHAGLLRILRFPPLGGVRARNAAWQSAKKEVVLFIDDDDVPLGRDWVANHAKNFADPLCVGVSGRQVFVPGEDPTPHNTEKNRRTCLRYTFFKIPRGRFRHTFRIEDIDILHGTNTAIRREAIERVGGWDEQVTEFVDENSFDFRFERLRRPGEHFVFDPLPVVWRRFDLDGGLGRRQASLERLLTLELDYSHGLIRRYYPLRFYGLYPAYLVLAVARAVEHMVDNHPSKPKGQVVTELVRSFLPTLRRAWRGPEMARPETG